MKTFTPMKMPLQDLTSYKMNTSNVLGETYKDMQVHNKLEKQRVRVYQLKQVSGTLTKSGATFATGNSSTKQTFTKPELVTKANKFLPYDMLMVPRALKMGFKTTSASEYNAKRSVGHK